MRKVPFSITSLLICVLLPISAFANDAFQLAQQNADTLIESYQQARQSGNPQQIKEAALALQKDPLAVQRVNKNAPQELKQQIVSDINEIRTEAKAGARKQLAEHYGISENRITFFEATNPSADVKLGQDWDVTPQIDGIEVPLDVAAPIVQKTFYEAAKGTAPPTPEAAAEYAHAQSVEPINRSSAEAYGSGGKVEITDPKTGETKTVSEGGAIIAGDKSGSLRDAEHLGHVMEHKSDLAKNRAAEKIAEGEARIKSEGLTGEAAEQVRLEAKAKAVGWEMEQGRQYSKQERAQIETRVEAKGGQIPEQVQKGNAILDKVAAGDISPEEGRARLAEIGETPESVIKKGTGLVEAAEKLGTTPQERIANAQAGEGPKDVFVENVKQRMELKKLERNAQKMKEGPAANLLDGESKSSSAHLEGDTVPDTRAQQVKERAAAKRAELGLAEPKSLVDGGKSSTSHSDIQGTADAVMDTADWAGWAAEGVQKEELAAAREGREFSKLNAAKEMAKGLAAGKSYETFKKHGAASKALADKSGGSYWLAGLSAWGSASAEFLHDSLTGIYRQHVKYQEEEMEKEIERAQKAGDAANPWRAKVPALMRIMGDVMQVNKLADYFADDSAKALRAQAEMEKKLQARAKAAVEVSLADVGDIERRMREALLADDGEALLEAQKEYHDRMAAIQDLRNELAAKGIVKPGDPEWTAINQSVDLLNPHITDQLREEMKAQLEENALIKTANAQIGNCAFDAASQTLQGLQSAEAKAGLAAQIESARAREAVSADLVQKAKALADQGQYEASLAQMSQALGQTACAETKAKISQALVHGNEQLLVIKKTKAIEELVSALDCSSFGPEAKAGWNPATESAVCTCSEGFSMNKSGTGCVDLKTSLLERADCSRLRGSSPQWDAASNGVACKCPAGYLIDPNTDSCVKRKTPAPRTYVPSPPSYGSSYESSGYDDYAQQQALQDSMYGMIQNMQAAQAGRSSSAGSMNSVDAMYANMANNSQWNDPTNSASGSAYVPAAPSYNSYSSTPSYSGSGYSGNSYSGSTGGQGQGEFDGPGRGIIYE